MDARDNTVRVSVPATGRYAPVARIAVSGLAIRLGFDVGEVEQLRLAVAAAANAMADGLATTAGATLDVVAGWDEERFTAELLPRPTDLPDATIERIRAETATLVSDRLRLRADHDAVVFELSPSVDQPDEPNP